MVAELIRLSIAYSVKEYCLPSPTSHPGGDSIPLQYTLTISLNNSSTLWHQFILLDWEKIMESRLLCKRTCQAQNSWHLPVAHHICQSFSKQLQLKKSNNNNNNESKQSNDRKCLRSSTLELHSWLLTRYKLLFYRYCAICLFIEDEEYKNIVILQILCQDKLWISGWNIFVMNFQQLLSKHPHRTKDRI